MFGSRWQRAMKGTAAFFLIATLAAGAVAGCSSANAAGGPLKLGEPDNGKAFTVKTGDTITVVIPGNMTTGYSWKAALSDADAALLQQQGDPVYADGSNGQLAGAGGMFTFTFKAVKAGQATLKLVYERPWEKDTPPIQTYQVQVTID